ncbi:hypothetical protein JCM8202_004982 [Rhodotorula sphaerocarpa]
MHLLAAPGSNLHPALATSLRSFSTSASDRRNADEPEEDRLTHTDPATGKAAMVSVSGKAATVRSATAVGEIYLGARAFALIELPEPASPGGPAATAAAAAAAPSLRTKKGDVLSVAQVAGILGAKHTATLIPLCHPLPLSHVAVSFSALPDRLALRIEATAECVGPTGVEMEALGAVSAAALTVWDMCKAVAGREMRIGEMRVVRKSGGKSGDWVRDDGEEGEGGADGGSGGGRSE